MGLSVTARNSREERVHTEGNSFLARGTVTEGIQLFYGNPAGRFLHLGSHIGVWANAYRRLRSD